ncbi:AraC family transcriptional regulator [Paenibacillus sp. LHD-38]|uniref:AraC family transcriptional regulator n=1 Tax=Paenibacillus sp. LHD-38 TaxID=3072143 RepID=UPI00280DD78D|nr:AraC family transcriptional regulator [Paenibacillus sp. LHD-38]MDQ8732996.1 AraC family transcriptional regulator [Paenibacillus sp. LHD-38]
MKPTIDSILQNQLNKLQAEVIMSAYTESVPGWSEQKSEPDFYRFCFTEKGKCWLVIEDEKYILQPGTLYLFPAGTLQSFGTEGSETFGRYWCHFRLELGDIQVINSLQLPPFVNVQDRQAIKELFDKMEAYQHSHTITRELRLKAVLLELLAFYLDEGHVQRENLHDPGSEEKWNVVLAYIEANLHENIQIEELAKFAFLHPNYFITSFKSIMGCSPIQYVTNRRIAIAKDLLMETELPVVAVAKLVGMKNHYLSRLFKRYTGVTPVQYRRIGRLNGSNLLEPDASTCEEENS